MQRCKRHWAALVRVMCKSVVFAVTSSFNALTELECLKLRCYIHSLVSSMLVSASYDACPPSFPTLHQERQVGSKETFSWVIDVLEWKKKTLCVSQLGSFFSIFHVKFDFLFTSHLIHLFGHSSPVLGLFAPIVTLLNIRFFIGIGTSRYNFHF